MSSLHLLAQDTFDNLFDFQELSGTFSTGDVAVSLLLSLVCSVLIGLTYRATHSGISYSQNFVQTLVLLSMLVSLVMLVVGSNIARAFSLVGALSIVRFRNAVKETRDVGYVFFAMAIGMAAGTQFYALAVIATVVICLVMILMDRTNLFALDVQSQVVKVQIPTSGEVQAGDIESSLAAYTDTSELISAESIRGGALTELVYSVKLRSGTDPSDIVDGLRGATGGQKVTVLTGYDRTDL
jgi:uncharacterized membrane protein YhiD involved in acid resistance